MKNIKKVIVCLICVVSKIVNNSVVYGREVSKQLDGINQYPTVSRGYLFNSNNITERKIIEIGGDLISIETVVYNNDTYNIVIKDSKDNERNLSGQYSFKEFKSMAEAYNESLYRGKRDLTGKQYKHQEIGNNSFIVTREEIVNMGTLALEIVLQVVTDMGIGGSAYTGIVSRYVFNSLTSGMPDYVEVDVTTYEILLTHDDTYYTHCYHSIIRSYKNDKLKKTIRDYTQVVGG